MQVLRWYLNRLGRMSAPELAYRISKAGLNIAERRGVLAFSRVPVPDSAPAVSEAVPQLAAGAACLRAADDVLAGRWQVFALEGVELGMPPSWNRDPRSGREAPIRFGPAIDYRAQAEVGDIKYLWEPNRHLEAVTLAQAWRLTGAPRYLHGLRRLLESWLDQCPYPLGPNWCSSLELGIRLINWSYVWRIVGGGESPLFAGNGGGVFRRRWLESIYRHVRFVERRLSKFSSANNHLIGEAAGIYVAACTWPLWPQAPRWREEAKAILVEEALKQNAPDGVNREQAVAYQQFVADFLLIALLTGDNIGDSFPPEYSERLQAMLTFVASIMDVGGNVPMIGDADDGYVVRLSHETGFCPYRSLLATGAVLFGREDLAAVATRLDDKSRWLLNGRAERWREPVPAHFEPRRAFADGGYYVLGDRFEQESEIRVVADAGPLGYLSIAAHGHADALAFTLSVGGHEFLVDPGTYAYHTKACWRDWFRGTRAHNTVTVDGLDQSVSGGNFMWTEHADARCLRFRTDAQQDTLDAEHDGYRRLADPVTHRRGLRLLKRERRLLVEDRLDCRGAHRAERCWHFAEACRVEVDGGTIVATNGGNRIQLRAGESVEVEVLRGDAETPGGWVSRGYDRKCASTMVVWRNRVTGTTQLHTEIDCGAA